MRDRTRFWTTRRWKSGARRQVPRGGSGQEAECSPEESAADYSENEIRANARPHPGPLPQERGKHAQVPGILTPSGAELFHRDWRRKPKEFLVAAERLAMVRAVYPDSQVEPPISAPESEQPIRRERADAVRELVRGRMEVAGPITESALADFLELSPGEIAAALLARA